MKKGRNITKENTIGFSK